ncbi:MAG: ketopantoate reductase family protein [Microbacteriaceae bacterium]
MRIGILGAGALGSLFAARLKFAGHQVQVVARGEQREIIAEKGIQLHGGYGEIVAKVNVVDAFSDVDVVFVCTKAHDTDEAMRDHRDELQGIPVVLVQNGVEGLAIASQYVQPERVFGAITLIAANFTDPGVVRVTNPQPTFIGRNRGPADAESYELAALLNSAVPTTAIDEFEGALWTKLVLNMVNAIPAITGWSVQRVVEDPFSLHLMAASMREAARVGLAARVQFAELEGLDATVILKLARWPLWRSKRIPRDIGRGMGPVPNLASTLQSIRRGRTTEIEFLNGAIVRTAESLGMDAPINRAITELVHQVEITGRHLWGIMLETALRDRGVRW